MQRSKYQTRIGKNPEMIDIGESLDNPYLPRVSEFIAERIGLNFPEERWCDLIRSVRAASHEFGFDNMEACIEWILSAPLTKREIEILASHLTVGETYFFRDAKLFETFEEHVFLPLIGARREKRRFLRIWSAGCASGEEAYSIAILLKKIIHDLKNWQVVILGTDINPHFLEKARKGIYSEWSFRGTPAWIRDRYFTRTANGRWEILPEIREMVIFSHHNLAEDPYASLMNDTGTMDIIICRNVLMYFTPGKATNVIHNFYQCLEDGGWLIVSPYEAPVTLFSEFKAVRLPDSILYQKSGNGGQGAGVRDQGLGIWGQSLTKAEHNKMNSNKTAAPRKIVTDHIYHPTPRTPIPDPRTLTPDPNAGLAHHYANMGMISEAIEHCKMAISEDKLNPSLHYLLATIFQEQGQIEEAVKSLKRALYLDQNFVLAHFSLGNLTDIQGRHRDSEKYFENALYLLNKFKKEDVLPGSDGITAGGLAEIITSMRSRKKREHG